jgi:hypothetical protein
LNDHSQPSAEELVQEHGLDRALELATDGTTAAQVVGDNYKLSVWREVKAILIKWRDEAI